MPTRRHRSHAAPRPTPAPPPAVWLALALILLLATVVRVWEAGRTPLWFDEIFTLQVARLEPRAMLDALADDMHPPLHYALEHAWVRLGGEGAMWLKSLSIVVGVGTVALAFALGLELAGAGAGLLAALLLALHRTHTYYSQEARSYALLWFLYLGAAWTAWRWVKRARARDALGYLLFATAALYTHYQAGLVLACLGLWGVLATLRDPRRLAGWIGLHALVALLFLPQLGTFVAQWKRLSAEHWISPATTAMLFDVLRLLAFGVAPLAPLLLLLALVPLGRRGRAGGVGLALMVSLVPMLIAFALTLAGAKLFTDRYMMFALAPFCVLVACGLVSLPWRRVGVLAGVAVMLVAGRTLVTRPPFAEAVSLERAERWLRDRVQPGDLVVSAETHAWFFLDHHAPELGEQVIVLDGPHLPYYDGAQFVPESARVRLAAWDSLTAGRRWFGVRTRHGGVDTRPILEHMMRRARTVEGFDRVTVVEGAVLPAIADSAAADSAAAPAAR